MCVFMCGLFGVGVACERSQRKSTRIARRAFYKNTILYRNSLKSLLGIEFTIYNDFRANF